MEKNKLGCYDLMIVAKYFNSTQDYINLELSTPKAKDMMHRFKFNAIPLDTFNINFFDTVETLHLYSRGDNHFKEKEYYKRIIWYEVTYSEFKRNTNESIIYKNVTLTEGDIKKYKLKEIPEGITSLGDECFRDGSRFRELIIPNSIISYFCNRIRNS